MKKNRQPLLGYRSFLFFTAILFSNIWIQKVNACTRIFYNNNNQAKVFARSTDLYVSDDPKMLVQPKGLERNGKIAKNPIIWQSKYGSVVITAFNSDTISDGMNEHGLGAHLLYLDGSKYPARDEAVFGLSNLIWVQYVLDNYKTVKEALEGLKQYQIQSLKVHDREWPVHLAIEDATGDAAIIEYIDGKQTINHGSEFRVITNEPPYSVQMKNLKRYQLFGGKLAMPGDIDPMSRFVRASSYLKTLPKPNNEIEALAYALSVLRTAMVPFGAVDTSGNEGEAPAIDTWPTRWVSLGDLSNKIYYFNSTQAPNIIWVDFNKIKFTKGSPVLILDPTQQTLTGDVSTEFLPNKS